MKPKLHPSLTSKPKCIMLVCGQLIFLAQFVMIPAGDNALTWGWRPSKIYKHRLYAMLDNQHHFVRLMFVYFWLVNMRNLRQFWKYTMDDGMLNWNGCTTRTKM